MDQALAQSKLWRGVVNAHVEQVAQALADGADVNQVHQGVDFFSSIHRGDTALHALFRTPEKKRDPVSGQNKPLPKGAVAKILELLLAHGADATVVDASGETPLMLLCKRWINELPAKLLAQFVEASKPVLDQADLSQGNTALHWACQRQEQAKVKALLKHGANPNAVNKHGKTPIWEVLEFINTQSVYSNPSDDKSWGNLAFLRLHGGQINHPRDGKMPWMEFPALPLDRLATAGADLAWKSSTGEGVLQAQIEKLEENSVFRIYARDNLSYLLEVPGIDWTARSTKSGRDAAQAVGLVYHEEMQALLPQIQARVQGAQLHEGTAPHIGHERKLRL